MKANEFITENIDTEATENLIIMNDEDASIADVLCHILNLKRKMAKAYMTQTSSKTLMYLLMMPKEYVKQYGPKLMM